MQTQEIQLEAEDDLISIRDRMAWAHTPRILLIWPVDGGEKIHPSDVLLLRRHADFLGQQLGLVTRDHKIRAVAHELRISVFSRVVDAQANTWLDERSWLIERRYPRRNLRRIRKILPKPDLYPAITHPFLRILILTVGVLAVLAVLLVLIPSAEIQITPLEMDQFVTIAVSSEPDVHEVQISGLVPQHILTLNVSGQDTALATGGTTRPDKKAAGQILFTNLTGKMIVVPAGSVLQTRDNPPILFETLQDVQVPAGKGKTASGSIQARLPGLIGNVVAGAVTGLEGDSGSLLAVANPAQISGGTEIKTIIATDQDRERLKKRLLAELQQQALEHFSSRDSNGDIFFSETLNQNRVFEETYSPQPGSPGEKLTLSMNVEYGMAYSTYADLRSLAEQVLNASLSAGYVPGAKQITLKTLSSFTRVKDVIHWQMSAGRKVYPLVNPGAVISLVQGRPVNSADKLLMDAFGLVQEPVIRMRPTWWPWLPFLPISISVKG